MAERYIKTDSGRAEIRARVHAISRTARNLLLIIDASKDGSEWVSMITGATAADLQALYAAGLIAVVPYGNAPAAAPAASAPAAANPAVAEPASASSLSYKELYDLLPSLAKEHLGLMKGYRFALAIEKASGLQGLQQVAQDLIAEVERAKGSAVARSVRRALMMT